MRKIVLAGVAVMAVAGWARPSAAQEPETRPNHARVSGLVVDEVTGLPIADALVVVDDERYAVLTDSAGLFDLGELSSGSLGVTVRRYGYQTTGMEAVVPTEGALEVRIPLPPEAVLLDGLNVVTDRLELMDQRLRRRRNATATSVRAFDQERLVQSAARDFLDFLRMEAALHPRSCGTRAFGTLCIQRRGRLEQPRVYVDEMPVIGGLDQLATYQPYDLYLVEVYGRGLEIRAYTHQFMERMAHRAVALIPINLQR
ncbi:MAG: carboxypeptidase regulatory-like domain-containing protein [Gemmatimonadota bacterium]|nr:carboxypeptidase regulatory-like domain-containing protein [Gemmatimonadota bacterium]